MISYPWNGSEKNIPRARILLPASPLRGFLLPYRGTCTVSFFLAATKSASPFGSLNIAKKMRSYLDFTDSYAEERNTPIARYLFPV